jgi:hypothetical protein
MCAELRHGIEAVRSSGWPGRRLDFIDQGARLAKLLEVFQWMALIVPAVAALDLVHRLA